MGRPLFTMAVGGGGVGQKWVSVPGVHTQPSLYIGRPAGGVGGGVPHYRSPN